jgi:hypothetical protein
LVVLLFGSGNYKAACLRSAAFRPMAVRFFYVDESYDTEKFCLSAISIRYIDWKKSYELVRDYRRKLRDQYGLYIRQEIHARDLVAGRGKISPKIISKRDRARIFCGLLSVIAKLPRVWVFNICLDVNRFQDVQIEAWDRLLNRIERTMLEADKRWYETLRIYRPRAMIFSDEGKEMQITGAFRKMGVYNPIPSHYGRWATGATKNIPIEHIVEEPIFKKSHQSFLIQLADCVSFALLKKETPLVFKTSKHGVPTFFEKCLSKVCFKAASRNDKLGIVRG